MTILSSDMTLILGGARSGKSTYAEKLAAELSQSVLYVATAGVGDEEMAIRVKNHQATRPATWQTLEAPNQVAQALSSLTYQPELILLDCITLLISNLVLDLEDSPQIQLEAAVQTELESLISLQRQWQVPFILVSNEVGLGLVPPYPLGRLYRDVLGRANQYLAAQADRVLFMVAGLPTLIKGGH